MKEERKSHKGRVQKFGFAYFSRIVKKPVFIFAVCLIVIPSAGLALFEGHFWNRIMMGVYLDGVGLGGKTVSEAAAEMKTTMSRRQAEEIVFVNNDRELFKLENGKGLYDYDLARSLEKVVAVGREGNFLQQWQVRMRSWKNGVRLEPVLAFDRDNVYRTLDDKLRSVETKAVSAQLVLNGDRVSIQEGRDGYEANKEKLIEELGHFWSFTGNSNQIRVYISPTPPNVTREDLIPLVAAAEMVVSRKLVVSSQELYKEQFGIEGKELFGMLSVEKLNGNVELKLDDYKVAERFKDLAEKVNKEPVDANFQFEDTRATVFQPSMDGTALDTAQLAKDLLATATDEKANASIEAPLKRTAPAITTASVNEYGIREKIATGRSNFRGSAAGRIHNVVLASSRLNGVLIAPDEVFSMYAAVGEVEKETGFKDAYIIKDGRTIPGVGGGLCQVSTTLFRAVLEAGLPIVERKPHAYRVSYYEQDSAPGIDAAVYFPNWDLKFKNDTGNYLLLETKVDTKKLTAEFNLYGVSDGRRVTMTKPVVSGQTPPPPDLYIDDPNLPLGQTVQDDHAAWGATVSFDRTVIRDGQELYQDTFKSAYKAWQAVYRVGVKDN